MIGITVSCDDRSWPNRSPTRILRNRRSLSGGRILRLRKVNRMNRRISRICCPLVLTGLLVFMIGSAQAGTTSHLSGSYQVVGKTDLGSHTRVRLQLRLANHGHSDLHIQRITLWSSSHPAKEGMKACAPLLVRSGTTESTTQEFIIPNSDYRLWSRGTLLRLLVAVERPDGREATELVRLNRISGGRAN